MLRNSPIVTFSGASIYLGFCLVTVNYPRNVATHTRLVAPAAIVMFSERDR
jgi:hypothetical protein